MARPVRLELERRWRAPRPRPSELPTLPVEPIEPDRAAPGIDRRLAATAAVIAILTASIPPAAAFASCVAVLTARALGG